MDMETGKRRTRITQEWIWFENGFTEEESGQTKKMETVKENG